MFTVEHFRKQGLSWDEIDKIVQWFEMEFEYMEQWLYLTNRNLWLFYGLILNLWNCETILCET